LDAEAFAAAREGKVNAATRSPLEQLTYDWAMRQMYLSERLCSAFSVEFGAMELTARKDGRGRSCQYPSKLVGVSLNIDAIPGLREERDGLAAEYTTLTDIPPAECMVVWWVDGLAARVEYERKPDGW
jgi:hypothetical protein